MYSIDRHRNLLQSLQAGWAGDVVRSGDNDVRPAKSQPFCGVGPRCGRRFCSSASETATGGVSAHGRTVRTGSPSTTRLSPSLMVALAVILHAHAMLEVLSQSGHLPRFGVRLLSRGRHRQRLKMTLSLCFSLYSRNLAFLALSPRGPSR